MKNQNSDRTQRSDQMIQKRFHRRWKRVVSLLSGIVVFCTTYALILPAITVESPVFCGKEEHIHSAICYQESSQTDSDGNPLKTLTCQLEEHEHTRQCESNMESVETPEDWKNFLRDEYLKESEERFEESDSSPEIASSDLPQNTENPAETSSDPSDSPDPAEQDEIQKKIDELSLNEKVLLAARSQLGTEARKDNFLVMEDGTESRWNRYASISNDPYDDAGTWFVPWVLELLGREVVWQPDRAAWIGQLEEIASFPEEAESGDIIILNPDSDIQSGILCDSYTDPLTMISWSDDRIDEKTIQLEDSVLVIKPEKLAFLEEVPVEDTSDGIGTDADSEIAEPGQSGDSFENDTPDSIEKTEEEVGEKKPDPVGTVRPNTADILPLADDEVITVHFDNNLPSGTELLQGQIKSIKNLTIYDRFENLPEVSVGQEDGEIVLPSPTNVEYRVSSSGHPTAYLFEGWKIGNELFQPGQKISYDKLKNYLPLSDTGQVTFSASWRGGENHSVNFYVLINGGKSVLDYSELDTTVDGVSWADNVYTTYVEDFDTPLVPRYYGAINDSCASTYIAYQSKEFVKYGGREYPTDKETRTQAGADAKIRSLASPDGVTKAFIRTGTQDQWYGPDYMGEKEYQLALVSFPSDELILQQLRNYQTQIADQNIFDQNKLIKDQSGTVISPEKLNAKNYTIQWRVFKLNHSDKKWHIDGKLKSKNGYLQVTKQFYSDQEAIDQRKGNFTIVVKDSKGKTAKKLVLKAGDNQNLSEDSDGADVYPAEVSGDGNTYIWRFPAIAFSEYTVSENNYSYSGDGSVSVAQYSVTNSRSGSDTSSDRQYYTGQGVKVTVDAYSQGDDPSSYQSVNFYNSYFDTSTFMLQKVDELGESIPRVSFVLEKEGKPYPVYQDMETGWWYPEQTTGSNYTVHSDGRITTDDQGNAFIVNFKDKQYAGTYTLTESTPYGYDEIKKLTLTIGNDGKVTLKRHDQAAFNDDGSILLVKNKAESISVTAEKVWDSSITSSNQKDVYVQLLRNGTPVGNPELLNSSNTWKKIWNDLPGKVGGEDAVYTVRETRIGDTYYDPRIPYDGFADYEVSYSNPVRDGNGNITLTVTNALYKEGFTVRKTDENGIGLQNAVFGVYSDPDCTTLVQQSTSGANGNLSFTALAAGDYYLKEISAPKGYQISKNIYLVKISGSGELFELKLIKDDNTQETVTSLVNQQKTLQLKVQKEGNTVKALPGAVFKLEKYKPSRNEYETIEDFGQIVSQKDGSVQVPPMTVGKYRLTELKAPDGYMLIPGSYEFEVTLEDSGDLKIKQIKQITEDPMSKEYQLDISNLTLTVTNDSGERLPDTGGTGTELYTFSGLAVMAVCLVYAISKRYSERRES